MAAKAPEELDRGLGSCRAEEAPALAEPCPGRAQEDGLQASREPAAEGGPASGVDASPKKMDKEPGAKGAPGPGKERLRVGATAPAPEPWIPPRPPPKAPVSPAPKPVARAPPSQPPVPKAEAGDRPEGPGDQEAAEKVEEPEPEEDTGEKAEEGPAPLAHGGPQEKARKERPGREERPRKERPRKEEKRRKEERPRKERPRAAREPGETAPWRWEAREGGHRPWARDSRDREHRKKQAWASPRPQAEEDRSPGRQKHRQGKGRD
ncbi:junctional sarcoplasmic reticulum protein 1 [Tupaia chinensis]|uniref:junctional sarcoplasmic reticulum protein 1 n=1 Tax=Tupaia chinensis TaxID=246437 RepID=UPI000FFBB568|nr:junctional sarcoplasmic reticulum protein 1 [Tupaia chinensis]